MALLQSIRDYFDHKARTRAFAEMVKRHRKLGEHDHSWHLLLEEDRVILKDACDSGAVAFLQAGVVDGLVQTPELALTLLQHGAQPSDKLVHALHDTLNHHSLWMGRLGTHYHPETKQGWMVQLINTAVERHPELDWFAQIHLAGTDPLTSMAIYALNMHADALCGRLCQRRKEEGILLGPLHATPEQNKALVDHLLTVYSDTQWWLPYDTHGQLLVDTVGKGDANAKGKASLGELELSVLARAVRRHPERVEALLALGPTVDREVVAQAAYVMHDRSYSRLNKQGATAAFKRLIEAYPGRVDLDMVVPSHDYHQPRLSLILQEHYPELLDDLRWRLDAERLDQDTPEASIAHAPTRRRL